MKKTILIGAMILGFVFVANIVFGNFYVIPTRPRIAGTEITSLPYTIPSSGFYFITRDLTSTGDGITVNADNVTIDLMGFSLIGSDNGYGIHMDGRANVEIRNGSVRGFGYSGVYEQDDVNGKNHRIIGLRVYGNGASGICLYGSGHLVKDCTSSDNDYVGIYVGKGCAVIGNIACFNNDGIFLNGDCLVDGNTAYDNDNLNRWTCATCTFGPNEEDGYLP
jgi:hypothetical protein